MNDHKKKTSTQPTAAEAYAARRSDIARLLDVLDMHLDAHDKAQAEHPTNWGRAGDLAKVRSDLVSLVAFMANMDPEHVEEFLRGD